MFGSRLIYRPHFRSLTQFDFCRENGNCTSRPRRTGLFGIWLQSADFHALVLFVSLLTYVIVKFGLSKIMILYGRRKFAAMLITGILLKIGFDFIYPVMPFEIAEFRGIGIIVPGLIANTIQRQGLTITLGSTLLLSGATFVIMYAYYLI